VLIRHLPPDSPLGDALRGGREHWSLEAHLLDDLRMVWTGDEKHPPKPHPGRFPDMDEPAESGPTEAELAAARERAEAHRRRFA